VLCYSNRVKISCFLLIFGLSAHADPGCLSVIQGKAINERAAKLLPPDCQSFRKSYLDGLKLLSQDPKKFSREFSKQIRSQKSFIPPYHALLISTFPESHSEEIKSAIHARALIETQKKFKYKYALAAEERINKGSCSAQFSEPAYDEICRSKDIAYQRIEKLQAVKR
jgi:hypothetical protein